MSVRCSCCFKPYSVGYGYALALRLCFNVAAQRCTTFHDGKAGGFGNDFEVKEMCFVQCKKQSGGEIITAVCCTTHYHS
ncbi:unnamed protein product [Strongylus vulgaris]|uniref:BPTI/Kunitz inhibitor domain-containing protein n=1 Tax=Strongylus vulgaris TaxID=40348 RepID=A0A3P7JXU2_STRVU|nr:unnamed protein product [Strongylus vulgaris]